MDDRRKSPVYAILKMNQALKDIDTRECGGAGGALKIYNAVQQMLSGGTFTSPTLSSATLTGTATVTGAEVLTAGVPLSFQQTTGALATQRIYNDGTGKLVLDSSPDGSTWTNALRIATDGGTAQPGTLSLPAGSAMKPCMPPCCCPCMRFR